MLAKGYNEPLLKGWFNSFSFAQLSMCTIFIPSTASGPPIDVRSGKFWSSMFCRAGRSLQTCAGMDSTYGQPFSDKYSSKVVFMRQLGINLEKSPQQTNWNFFKEFGKTRPFWNLMLGQLEIFKSLRKWKSPNFSVGIDTSFSQFSICIFLMAAK